MLGIVAIVVGMALVAITLVALPGLATTFEATVTTSSSSSLEHEVVVGSVGITLGRAVLHPNERVTLFYVARNTAEEPGPPWDSPARNTTLSPSLISHAAWHFQRFLLSMPSWHTIVQVPTLTIHADLDPLLMQHLGKGLAGELRSLVSVEYLRPPLVQCFLQRRHTEAGVQGVGELPGQYMPAC